MDKSLKHMEPISLEIDTKMGMVVDNMYFVTPTSWKKKTPRR
uniref:Uncharacterized protein n=1 Tax=Arundo donax TaxID=35708 RepID=A0A0A9GY87_ARUDO